MKSPTGGGGWRERFLTQFYFDRNRVPERKSPPKNDEQFDYYKKSPQRGRKVTLGRNTGLEAAELSLSQCNIQGEQKTNNLLTIQYFVNILARFLGGL